MTTTKLTANFSLEELTQSQTATAHDLEEIQSNPSKQIIDNLMYLAGKCLEPIRAKFGKFSPTNAYRSPELNAIIAPKSTKSFHLYGQAADINFRTKEKNKKLYEFIRDNLDFTELINEYDFQWVHVAIARGREKEKVVKKATKEKGIEIISRG